MSVGSTLNFILQHPLNQQRKLAALWRFLRWQVVSRLVPGPHLHEWVGGTRFWVRQGETGLTGNLYTGLHEFADMGFLLHLLRPQDLFVDVGANAGSYTMLACGVNGASGVAYEPVPATYERLLANIRVNGLDTRVRCVNKAVGDKVGVVAFSTGSDTTNRALSAGESRADQRSVEVTLLDTDLAGVEPTAIKIDVEGYETPVLQGATTLLAKPSLLCVILELNGSGAQYGFDESNILTLMAAHGFVGYAYDPLRRQLSQLTGKNAAAGNTLFLRNLAAIEQRLQQAPAVSINGRRF